MNFQPTHAMFNVHLGFRGWGLGFRGEQELSVRRVRVKVRATGMETLTRTCQVKST